MVAALLYLIGLIALLINIAIAGYSAPEAISQVTTAMDAGSADMVAVIAGIAVRYLPPFYWILGGLLLMGFARVVMLLASIDKSLRGQV